MVSKLTLDRSDTAVDALVSAWELGGEYNVELTIRQTAADKKMARFDVISISEGGEAVLDDEGPPAKPPPPPTQSIPISYRK